MLAEKTVKNDLPAPFAKLGVERRTQAAAFAARVFDPACAAHIALTGANSEQPGQLNLASRACGLMTMLLAGLAPQAARDEGQCWSGTADPVLRRGRTEG